MEKKAKKHTVLKAVVGILLLLVLVVAGYFAYVFLTYNRLLDRMEIEIEGQAKEEVAKLNTEYHIATQNLGFGAYTADYTFFMDGGTESRARSKESVLDCLTQAATTINQYHPDFILLQETDLDSTRSYHVNEKQFMADYFSDFQTAYTINYHSAYLMYPLREPHGKSNSGLDTLSLVKLTGATRRSLPISEGVDKILDLDRCISISRALVENGKELVLYNVHLSAYGAGEEIKNQQLALLFEDMKREYDAGNYVICGGDYNADFTGDSVAKLNSKLEKDRGWTMPLSEEMIPEGIKRCISYENEELIPTARDCDLPYEPGNFTVVVDGFFVSDNIEVTMLENVQTGFAYSDHNPVVMSFLLKE